MKNITLDHNCIATLENARYGAANNSEIYWFTYLQKLVEMHQDKGINLRIVAISASEARRRGGYIDNFAEFMDRIADIGLKDTEILPPIAYIGVTFLDWCVLASEEMIDLEHKIHKVLFPKRPYNYIEFCRKENIDPETAVTVKKWRNTKCDVLSMWSHIHYEGDIFVTTDWNFHKETKKPRLIRLGARAIEHPEHAVANLTI